jgi:hypothetical protein
MKCAIQIEEFAENVKLPDGFRFKECSLDLSPDNPDNKNKKYIESNFVTIERISDGKLASFEISSLRNEDGSSLERGKCFVPVESLAWAVDRAIQSLEL